MNLIELQRALRQLRCSGMAIGLETRLLEAQTDRLAPIDFLSTLVQDELLRRQDRLLDRRIKQAGFRDPGKTLDTFVPGPLIQATFATGSSPITAAQANGSDVLVVPTGMTSMRLTLTGLDGSNTVKTQKRTTPGGTFTDQTTYNSDQANVAVTVATGEEWRVVQITQQAIKDVRFKMSCEN